MTLDDDATANEELRRKWALEIRKPVPERTGRCLECGEPVPESFCDKDCRDTYEQRKRFNR